MSTDGVRVVAYDAAMRADLETGYVPRFVYDNFYLDGWEVRQREDLAQVLAREADCCDVALVGGELAGWVCTRIHAEDSMGEVYMLCVDPEYQRRGVGAALLRHAHARAHDAGMRMVMVETGDDAGHAPARAAYEAAGYVRWPVARYFKEL
ncbi:GNAT family N-acetyltransferase [Actinomyces qiguomingii]|uniref:GNAT family N-acetyltransferase n=1 Tax=Actinomyces qiguomingii TaxID=2057800 RepID=UPI000CA019F1|nr:GNAT family N-acetyltransferase [Actinomyces qiguomingii]